MPRKNQTEGCKRSYRWEIRPGLAQGTTKDAQPGFNDKSAQPGAAGCRTVVGPFVCRLVRLDGMRPDGAQERCAYVCPVCGGQRSTHGRPESILAQSWWTGPPVFAEG